MKEKVIVRVIALVIWFFLATNVWAIDVIKIDNIKLTAYPHNKQLTSCLEKPSECSLALPRTLKSLYNIPCGTEAYVVGVGWFTVEDTMSKQYDKAGDIFRADRWMSSRKKCKDWGHVNVTIYFYKRAF